MGRVGVNEEGGGGGESTWAVHQGVNHCEIQLMDSTCTRYTHLVLT